MTTSSESTACRTSNSLAACPPPRGRLVSQTSGSTDRPSRPKKARQTYMRENDLEGLPLSLDEFLAFCDGRREKIEVRLRELLGSES